jgi:hypothetical protein
MAYNPINLGPATMANSQAVSLPTDQVAIPVNGTVTANAGTGTMNVSVQNTSLAVTGPLTDALLRASAVPVVLSAGSSVIGSISNASFASTQSGIWNVGLSAGSNAIGSITNASFGISGLLPAFAATPTVTANAGTGNFTVVQSTAASLKTQAEVYQGGVPVSSSAPLAVSSAATFNGGVICGSGNDPASLPTGCGSSIGTFGGTAGLSIPIVEEPANIYGWYFYNPNTVAAYVKIWNTTNSLVNFNSNISTPLVCVLVIPPVSGANVFGIGITCNAGVRITITTSRNGQTSMPLPIDYNIFYKTA